jgi:hypothetical protein
MPATTDADRQAMMRARIESELRSAASRPGGPDVIIHGWGDQWPPELRVVVGGKARVLEVSDEFLEDEPDSESLKKVSVAASQLVYGEAPRVQLLHRGVFAAWRLSRE